MRTLQTRDISRIKDAQSDVMGDLCNITHVYHVTGTQSQTVESNVRCGINFISTEEAVGVDGALRGFNVELRIPISQYLGLSDLVELVSMEGTNVSGTYQAMLHPDYNSSVQKIKLRRVKA